MTPKLITAIAISSVFSFSAFASGSSEPVPTEEAVVDIELEDDAARKRKKNAQRRSAQQQRARNSQQQANRAQRQQQQERVEQRAQQRRSDQRAQQRRQETRSANQAAAARQQARHRAEAQRAAAVRHHRTQQAAARHRHVQARHNSHVRPHRWYHRWHHTHARPIRWYHGVFVYGPAPHRHHRVRSGVYSETVPMPRRAIDRKGAFSVGLTTGSYASGYDLGGDFSDFGLGVNARFRPVEGLGFEVAYSVHDETFDAETQRTTTMLQPSVQVFAAPWSRVSPYASVGVTFTDRVHDDTWSDGFDEYRSKFENSSFGPHAGIGLEIALGQNAAIDFEARAIGYLDNQEGGTIPGAVQTTFGAQWYF